MLKSLCGVQMEDLILLRPRSKAANIKAKTLFHDPEEMGEIQLPECAPNFVKNRSSSLGSCIGLVQFNFATTMTQCVGFDVRLSYLV